MSNYDPDDADRINRQQTADDFRRSQQSVKNTQEMLFSASSMIHELRKTTETWHQVDTPRGKTMAEITEWLDTNIEHRYWWDNSGITRTMDRLWIEEHDDLVLYQMVWKDYL